VESLTCGHPLSLILVMSKNEPCTVIVFKRNDGEYYLAVREFDTKFVKNCDQTGPSEQAHRASIRQAILSMKLRMEPANKQEIQFLKSQGALGKRAPSCSLLTRDDMIRLLESFGKRGIAERLRIAMSVPPDMKSYAGFLFIPPMDPLLLPADTVPVPSRRRRAISQSTTTKSANISKSIDLWDAEVMTPPPPEPVDKQALAYANHIAGSYMPNQEIPTPLSMPGSQKRTSEVFGIQQAYAAKVRKLTYAREQSMVEAPIKHTPCKCADCLYATSHYPPYGNTVYSQFMYNPHHPTTTYYSYQPNYSHPPHPHAHPHPPPAHLQHSHVMYSPQAIPPHMAAHMQPQPHPYPGTHVLHSLEPYDHTPTPTSIQILEDSILGSDCTLLTASKNMCGEPLATPTDVTCAPGCVCPHCNVPPKETYSPLPPLFKIDAPSPFGCSDFNSTTASGANSGTPVANLETADVTDWYFGQ